MDNGLEDKQMTSGILSEDYMKEIASVRLGPKTLRTLDEEVKSLVSAWRFSLLISSIMNRISWKCISFHS